MRLLAWAIREARAERRVRVYDHVHSFCKEWVDGREMLNKHFSANSNAKPTKAFYNNNNGRKNAYENIQQQQEQQCQEDNNSKSKKKEIKKTQ